MRSRKALLVTAASLATSGTLLLAPGSAAAGPQSLCGIDEFLVPESSTGVVTAFVPAGQYIRVTPSTTDTIWAGVWFTGRNGPAGWTTTAPSGWPVPGARKYSLVGRMGNDAMSYVGASERLFWNHSSGTTKRVRLRVNDNVPGNGNGAFKVYIRYNC